jgi:hypothetical protein
MYPPATRPHPLPVHGSGEPVSRRTRLIDGSEVVVMLIAFIGLCALVIGLAAGVKLGRRPSPNAEIRRELRHLRGTARPSAAEHRALYAHPQAMPQVNNTVNPF